MTDDHHLRPHAFKSIVFGGLIVGVLDFLDATIFFGLWYKIPTMRVWQGVAAGLLGRDRAIGGGLKTALLGVALHFLIAFILATIFFIASSLIPWLIKHPIFSGLCYGVIIYFVMQHVVVALSAIGRRPPSPWPSFLNGVIGHALLIGLPFALIARWSAKK